MKTLADRIRESISDAQMEEERAQWGNDEEWFGEKFASKRTKVRAAAEKLIALAEANPRARSPRDLRRLPGVTAEDVDLVSIRMTAANV